MEAKRTSSTTRTILKIFEAKKKPTKDLSDLRAILDNPGENSFDLHLFLKDSKVMLNPPTETLTPKATLPLISAVFRGSAFMRLLLNAGADANAQGALGGTAIYHTALLGDSASTRLLLEAGADPSLPYNSKQNTVLHRLARIKEEEFGQPRGKGLEPYASFDVYKKIIHQLLAENPLLLLQPNTDGDTPIDLANRADGPMKGLFAMLSERIESQYIAFNSKFLESINQNQFIPELIIYIFQYAGPQPPSNPPQASVSDHPTLSPF